MDKKQISWLSMVISFSILSLFSILFFALEDELFAYYIWFSTTSFPGKQIQIWAILLMVFSILGLIVSVLLLILNFKKIEFLNKIASYFHILVAVFILFVILMIIVSVINSKENEILPTIIMSLSSVSAFSVVSTTGWAVKEQLF